MNGTIFGEVEAWFKAPVSQDLSPLKLVGLTVLFVIVVMWTIDGLNIIKEGLSQ